MPTDLPAALRRRRTPWPGQRHCFMLAYLAGLPIIILAMGLASLLRWLDPDPPPR